MKKQQIKDLVLMPLADLLVLYYLWITFSNKTLLEKVAKLTASFHGLQELDPYYLQQLVEVSLQGLKLFLVLMALYHLFIYISHYYKKEYAKLYLFIYSVFAIFGFFMGGVSSLVSGAWIWGLIFIALSIFYITQIKGLKS